MGGGATQYARFSHSGPHAHLASGVATVPTDPYDLDEEEIAAYAAEAELNLDDLVPEDIFSLSDYEDALDADVKME